MMRDNVERLGEHVTAALNIDVNLGPRAVAEPGGRAAHAAAGFRCYRARRRPGIEPSGGMAAYAVSKAALVHLTHILDIEPRPHGIRVNAVAPQLLDTLANRATFPAAVMAHAGQGSAGRIPNRRDPAADRLLTAQRGR